MTHDNQTAGGEVPRASHAATDNRDEGSVLLLVLAMIVVGSLIVIPTMTYAVTVLKANSVLSDKTQRFEAVKAGMRTALYDPLELYRTCDEEVAPKAISSIEMPSRSAAFAAGAPTSARCYALSSESCFSVRG